MRERRSAPVWLLAAVAAATLACYPAHMGVRPRTERLPEFVLGVSTKADARSLLGEPLGRGAARLAPELSEREIWVYGHMAFEGTPPIEESVLLLFFAGDRYDGHLWRANATPPEPEGRR